MTLIKSPLSKQVRSRQGKRKDISMRAKGTICFPAAVFKKTVQELENQILEGKL
ncbi:MAG: hypothetical protein V1850_00200 [Candidatus Bathyarchaeota archaeon]